MIHRTKLFWISLPCLAVTALWIAAGASRQAGVTDFAAYWTASRRLLARENPYAVAPVLAMEKQLGFRESMPLVMRNPPWAITFVLPLGLFSYATAQRLWWSFGFIAILVSAHLLWRSYADQSQPSWLGWLTTGLFLPVSTVLVLGQIGPLILLGVTGFLICLDTRWDFAAGAFALIIAVKPHLAFLFWPALVLWLLRERRWRVLGGFIVALGAASIIPLSLDSGVFNEYRGLWQVTSVSCRETPTLGGVLCLLGQERRWLAFVPAVAAAWWFVFHWIKHRCDWSWWEQMPRLLLVSVACSPYEWFFDQVVLLPAVLQWAARTTAKPRRSWFWPAVIYLGVNGAALGLLLGHHTTFWYAWTAPSWLLLLWPRTRGLPARDRDTPQQEGSRA